MRRLTPLLILTAALLACSPKPEPVRLAAGCDGPDGSCARYVPATDADGAPLPRASIIAPFTGPIRVADLGQPITAVTAAFNFDTRAVDLRLVPVRSIRVDGASPRQLTMEIDGLLADGAAIDLPDGLVKDASGRGLGAVTIKVKTPLTPLAVALSAVAWEPAEPSLFSADGIQTPKGTKDAAAVRRELEERLRVRPEITDEKVARVLARYDGDALKRKVPDARVRAGLLTLTGTTGEPAIDFIESDTNRRGVPFDPIEVMPIDFGALAFVHYDPWDGAMTMVIDAGVAADRLELIGVVIAHETLHSNLAGGSATEETLAMASAARMYEEFLVWDPALALTPSETARSVNVMTLALRNSGRFSFPRAGLLPRPGVDDALRATDQQPARSFKDMLFNPDWYGELPPTGKTGTEVIEGYYQRMSGLAGDQGRLALDQNTIKLYDKAIDAGFTDEQILTITDALRLKPVPLPQP